MTIILWQWVRDFACSEFTSGTQSSLRHIVLLRGWSWNGRPLGNGTCGERLWLLLRSPETEVFESVVLYWGDGLVIASLSADVGKRLYGHCWHFLGQSFLSHCNLKRLSWNGRLLSGYLKRHYMDIIEVFRGSLYFSHYSYTKRLKSLEFYLEYGLEMASNLVVTLGEERLCMVTVELSQYKICVLVEALQKTELFGSVEWYSKYGLEMAGHLMKTLEERLHSDSLVISWSSNVCLCVQLEKYMYYRRQSYGCIIKQSWKKEHNICSVWWSWKVGVCM